MYVLPSDAIPVLGRGLACLQEAGCFFDSAGTLNAVLLYHSTLYLGTVSPTVQCLSKTNHVMFPGFNAAGVGTRNNMLPMPARLTENTHTPTYLHTPHHFEVSCTSFPVMNDKYAYHPVLPRSITLPDIPINSLSKSIGCWTWHCASRHN